MIILIAYASKHGATQGIAERIAERLAALGLDAQARPIKEAGDPGRYDAIVLGAAAYLGSWLKEATDFAHRYQEVLASRPVWLFSSGPLGTEKTDAQGHDLLAASEPKEFAELKTILRPRDTQIFFGALDPDTLGFAQRALRKLPAGRALLPEGDFRDWQAIDAWAERIAHALAEQPAGHPTA
jgi:menaquinone-dependent protoporphyrinogen oxidase